MRTSSYAIFVDLPVESGGKLLVHGYTGAYDQVTDAVVDYLMSRRSKSKPDAAAQAQPPSAETLEILAQRGYLTELSEQEERERLAAAVNRVHGLRARHAPQFLLMPTYDCNLRCRYCFQSDSRADPKAPTLKRMTMATADRILAALPRVTTTFHGESTADKLEIGFFGGEPLLPENRPLIAHVIDKAKSMGPARFWAVTNATGLADYADLLGPEGIDTIQVTLDGAPAEHDQRRIWPDGSGSFARIMDNISLALDRGTFVQVRVNVDAANIAGLPLIAQMAAERGWVSNPRFDLHAAALSQSGSAEGKAATFTTRGLMAAMADLAREHPSMAAYRRPDQGMKNRLRRLFDAELEPMEMLKTGFCGAHDRMYVFDPSGDAYACWERTAGQDAPIGRVGEDGEFHVNPEAHDKWRGRTAASNPVCGACPYLLYCGGGCAVKAEEAHGAFFTNFCDEFGRRFRRRVAEAYLEHLADSQTAEGPVSG